MGKMRHLYREFQMTGKSRGDKSGNRRIITTIENTVTGKENLVFGITCHVRKARESRDKAIGETCRGSWQGEGGHMRKYSFRERQHLWSGDIIGKHPSPFRNRMGGGEIAIDESLLLWNGLLPMQSNVTSVRNITP